MIIGLCEVLTIEGVHHLLIDHQLLITMDPHHPERLNTNPDSIKVHPDPTKASIAQPLMVHPEDLIIDRQCLIKDHQDLSNTSQGSTKVHPWEAKVLTERPLIMTDLDLLIAPLITMDPDSTIKDLLTVVSIKDPHLPGALMRDLEASTRDLVVSIKVHHVALIKATPLQTLIKDFHLPFLNPLRTDSKILPGATLRLLQTMPMIGVHLRIKETKSRP